MAHRRPSRFGCGFTATFLWQATMDHTAYCAIPAALAVLRSADLAALQRRNHALVTAAANEVAAQWGTEVLTGAHPDRVFAMAVVRVPTPASSCSAPRLPGSADRQVQPAWLLRKLSERQIEVPVFAWRGSVYVRLSAQVYNSAQHYRALATHVQQLLE